MFVRRIERNRGFISCGTPHCRALGQNLHAMETSADRNTLLIQRILRVNHAGEHGAVSIYSAQIARAQKANPELIPWLTETLEHEKTHRAMFLEAMPSRAAKPCRALQVWSIGGMILGSVTALFGRAGVMICTAAVERTVHKHLVEQIGFLVRHDPELADIIRSIQVEEDQHLQYAAQRLDPNSGLAKLVGPIVAVATELLILISTRGDSRKLKMDLEQV